ncbi:serine hydrolase domain-containing protein [Catalinimonas niigatensis]|uniref:serine hydrolase domain-containing protein n=1 Tax=Catalinimonas niigatensis TaxID=1397264 RepID=UPI002664F590|nr:serine hydrolase domain-containing protein [Catalinimonas niigatensis]WPP48803.1 serine hydrolase domain-containing protein [Catalinimonas niigatensis]
MKHNLFLVLCFFLAFTASAQTKSLQKSPPLSEASPASVGMSAERLARIDAMCQQAVKEGNVPGIVALVARKGKIVYHKAFGMADSPSGRAMKKDDIFRIASQSKAITSTAVMMLWEEGHFQLDDPISKYIPEFKEPQLLKSFKYSDTTFTTEPASREITIRHLLTHTSGLGYGMIDGDERFKMMYQKAGVMDLFTTEDISIEQSVKRLATLPLHHNPGDAYTYSEGLDVLGYFIEVISGMPFDQFLRERLFDPLGMEDTWFYLPENKASRLVAVQRKEGERWTTYPVTFYDPQYPVKGAKTFFSGGAGLSSTTKDYATFLQMYLNEGELNGVRILSRTTIQSIMGNQIGDLWAGTGRHYGLAFGVLTEEGQAKGGSGSVGTFDWGGYFNTQYFADPEEDLIGIIMKQTQGPTNDQTGWKFRLLTGQAIDD